MPTPNPIDRLLARLRIGVVSSPELEQTLGVSQSWISRAMRHLIAEGRVVRIGTTRGARYALRRDIEGTGSSWPLRRIDRQGNIHELGTLYALVADEYYFEATQDALDRGFAWGGLSAGLPYFLKDQRPDGFLGRAVPLRYPDLKLPQRVTDWTDDHYLRYLTLRGGDAVSDLVLGRSAFDDYLANLRHRSIIAANERETRFPRLVDQVMAVGLPGSSAHGEHPKFAVLVQIAGDPSSVLVKFSPPVGSAVGQRWSDLLIAEHQAHEVLRRAGIPTANSRVFKFADRTYLEMDRFDREGLEGRIGVTSLLAIDTHLHGALDDWIAAGVRLNHDRRIDSHAFEQIQLVATFGGLIANTDLHFGNLAFYDQYDGQFALAPVYDMLPMLFAPEHDQIVARVFQPPDPTSDTLQVWAHARALAEEYWYVLAGDGRVSPQFRAVSESCLQTLNALPRTGAFAP